MGNKDEVEKCKKIAMSALSAGDCSKATRFLQKAKRMSPDDASIDALLQQAEAAEGASGGADAGASRRTASPEKAAEGPRHRSSATTSNESGPSRTSQAQPGARAGKAGNYTSEQ